MPRSGDGLYQRGKSKTWWLEFMHEGRRHFVRLGRGITRTVAREIAQVKRAGILKGEAGIGRTRADVSFDKAAEHLLTWARAEKRPKTAASYAECVKQLRRSFGGRRLSELSVFTVEKHKGMRMAEGAKVAPNRELAILRLLVNRAQAAGLYQGDDPARRFKRLPESEGRVRWLEPVEEAALLAELAEPYRTLVLVGIHAGLRVRAEALPLTWRDADLSRGLLTVPAAVAKSGRSRVVCASTAPCAARWRRSSSRPRGRPRTASSGAVTARRCPRCAVSLLERARARSSPT